MCVSALFIFLQPCCHKTHKVNSENDGRITKDKETIASFQSEFLKVGRILIHLNRNWGKQWLVPIVQVSELVDRMWPVIGILSTQGGDELVPSLEQSWLWIAFQLSWRSLTEVLTMSWKLVEEVLKYYQDNLKTIFELVKKV